MVESREIDVAIVGAGIAGLYVAFRLTTDDTGGTHKTVELFEATDHLGGRLKSIEVPHVNMPLELGAMRFKKNHRFLYDLMEHLRQESRLVELEDENYFDEKYFLRGVRNKQLDELATEAYRLPKDEQPYASSPGLLIAFAINQALNSLEFPALSKDDLAEMNRQISETTPNPESMINIDWLTISNHGYLNLGPKSVYLFTVGFWNLLAHFLSNQAMRLIEDSLGYHSIIGNWNAAVALPWFIKDFSDANYYVPLDGFGSLVDTLRQEISTNGGTIHTGRSLVRASQIGTEGSCKWQLTFGDGSTCFCKNLVLALPRVALESLDVDAVAWDGFKKKYLSSVRPHNLFKILLVYDEPWWIGTKYPGADSGKVITDQPLRQIYYYGPKWISSHTSQRRNKSDGGWPFIMASYCDEYYSEFWSTFFSTNWREFGDVYLDETKITYLDEQVREQLRAIGKKDGVHWRMINKIKRQLADLHEKEIPPPIIGVFMNWDWNPYGGGWHTWEVSVRQLEVANIIIQPPISDLYICGEAYSTEQGWIEGALNTAERVVQKLGVSPPSWFNGGDYEDYLFDSGARSGRTASSP